jgi:hypothetical protein
MPLVLGGNSITINGKVVSNMSYFGGYNDPLGNGEPTADFRISSYTHSGGGEAQTSYTVNFPQSMICDILIVAGGGGGGTNAGAGGGAGGLILLESTTVTAGTYVIMVGNGGAGGTTSAVNTLASNGNNSSFGSNIAIAGGAGVNSGGANGNPGGSGGGAGNDGSGNRSGGAGTSGQGFKGGDGTVPGGAERTGGGGGGAGAAGQNSVSQSRAGDGGIGRNMSLIFGTSVGQSGWFAGGGGGGVHSGTGGTGGQGGGGSENVAGVNGTGGGGGGGRSPNNGLRGGSGIVLIRYRISSVAINNDFKYLSFFNDGTNQTSYTVNFPTSRTCDILVVGGGGAGGGGVFGGGGGAGGVLFSSNITLNNGNYNIKVGKGGTGNKTNNNAENGQNSSIIINGTEFIALGGGGGATRIESSPYSGRKGNDGGSGGGGGHSDISTTVNVGGSSTQPSYLGWLNYGNNGGEGKDAFTTPGHASGGGGGAGSVGGNTTSTGGGIGGAGKEFISYFGTGVGHNGWFAGGGGGSTNAITIGGYPNGGNGLFGGGGIGGTDNSSTTETPGGEGLPGTGGGGGGSKVDGGSAEDVDGGDGGSGVVIIRFPRTKIPFDTQWTYNTENANVYHMGNVGIGTTNPNFINSLEVVGNTHSTTYSAGKKTFKIEHPLKINKWLYHGCIEGPRFDNIYRGKKLIKNGKCEIDIDKECNTTGGMTPGTFTALNINYQLYLQNIQTYDEVKGSINGSIISIECENTTDEIEVGWMVVGERHDEHVINTPLTNNDGNLVCEHSMSGYVNYENDENEPVTNVDITEAQSDESLEPQADENEPVTNVDITEEQPGENNTNIASTDNEPIT